MFLKQRIIREVGVSCFDPANGVSVSIATTHAIPVNVSARLLKRAQSNNSNVDVDGALVKAEEEGT